MSMENKTLDQVRRELVTKPLSPLVTVADTTQLDHNDLLDRLTKLETEHAKVCSEFEEAKRQRLLFRDAAKEYERANAEMRKAAGCRPEENTHEVVKRYIEQVKQLRELFPIPVAPLGYLSAEQSVVPFVSRLVKERNDLQDANFALRNSNAECLDKVKQLQQERDKAQEVRNQEDQEIRKALGATHQETTIGAANRVYLRGREEGSRNATVRHILGAARLQSLENRAREVMSSREEVYKDRDDMRQRLAAAYKERDEALVKLDEFKKDQSQYREEADDFSEQLEQTRKILDADDDTESAPDAAKRVVKERDEARAKLDSVLRDHAELRSQLAEVEEQLDADGTESASDAARRVFATCNHILEQTRKILGATDGSTPDAAKRVVKERDDLLEKIAEFEALRERLTNVVPEIEIITSDVGYRKPSTIEMVRLLLDDTEKAREKLNVYTYQHLHRAVDHESDMRDKAEAELAELRVKAKGLINTLPNVDVVPHLQKSLEMAYAEIGRLRIAELQRGGSGDPTHE